MHTLRSRGFTLIELLVVIAIIGILSAVVLASLNTARNKGNDASVKANAATIQTQAELFYDSHTNKYNTTGLVAVAAATACTAADATSMFINDVTIKAAIVSMNTSSGGAATCTMDAAGQTWLIWSPLKTAGFWCIDQTGAARTEAAAQVAQTQCP